jgi:hypothetical protein
MNETPRAGKRTVRAAVTVTVTITITTDGN